MDTHSSLYKISTLSKNKLDQLIEAFKNISNTPLLIYGPTGTGKSFHIRSIAAMLDMQLEYVMEPDKFSGKTLFKKHVIYIDTDDIRDLRNMPRNNVVIESRCISSAGKERNAMLIKFGKVSAIKIRKVLREYTGSTTTTRRLRQSTHNERIFMNEPSFTHTINSRTAQNLCLSRAMIPYKTNTSFKDHLRSSALHSNINPDLTIFQGNMHLFPYVFSASNIFTFSYTNQITIFHYLGKIFYSKPSYKDHNYFDNKTVIKFLFENYLLFYDYDDAFCDDLSLLYARNCYELITHMAYHIKNRRAGQFISFKPPCQSPIHLHYKNEFEDLS